MDKRYFQHKNKADYEQAHAKQQQAWLKMELRVSQRLCELQAQALKHYDQKRQHDYYARAYERLAYSIILKAPR